VGTSAACLSNESRNDRIAHHVPCLIQGVAPEQQKWSDAGDSLPRPASGLNASMASNAVAMIGGLSTCPTDVTASGPADAAYRLANAQGSAERASSHVGIGMT